MNQDALKQLIEAINLICSAVGVSPEDVIDVLERRLINKYDAEQLLDSFK